MAPYLRAAKVTKLNGKLERDSSPKNDAPPRKRPQNRFDPPASCNEKFRRDCPAM